MTQEEPIDTLGILSLIILDPVTFINPISPFLSTLLEMREFPPLSNFPPIYIYSDALLWWENSGRGNFPLCLIFLHFHLLWCSISILFTILIVFSINTFMFLIFSYWHVSVAILNFPHLHLLWATPCTTYYYCYYYYYYTYYCDVLLQSPSAPSSSKAIFWHCSQIPPFIPSITFCTFIIKSHPHHIHLD